MYVCGVCLCTGVCSLPVNEYVYTGWYWLSSTTSSTCLFWDRFSHWTRSSPFHLNSGTRNPWGSACLYSSVMGSQMCFYSAWLLCGCWGFQLRSSCLHCEHFIHRASFLVPHKGVSLAKYYNGNINQFLLKITTLPNVTKDSEPLKLVSGYLLGHHIKCNVVILGYGGIMSII